MPEKSREPVTSLGSAGGAEIMQPREATPMRPRAEYVEPPTKPAGLTSKRKQAPVNVGNTERTATAIGGSLLALYGLTRRSWWAGLPLVGLGTALAYRGAVGRSKTYQRIGVDKPDGPVVLTQSVTINRNIDDVYSFWRQLENLPKFMRHVRSVTQTSATRSHWVAQGGGSRQAIEWDSDLIEDKPNEIMRWRTVPNGAIEHSGEVRFKRAPGDRGTEVHVRIQYHPSMGTAVAAVMYPYNKKVLDEEMRRLKQVLEVGEIATTEGQPSGRRRSAPSGGAR